MTPMRRTRSARLAAVALLAGVLVAGCTGGGGDQPPAQAEPTGGATAPAGVDPEQVSADLLDRAAAAPEPVATADGVLRVQGAGGPAPGRVEILSVQRSARGTLLTWRVSSASGLAQLKPDTFRTDATGVDTQGVDVVDTTGEQRLKPYRYRDETGFSRCICSTTPVDVDEDGQVLHGLYPPLADGAESVSVEVPGFPTLESVPVAAAQD
jgi:hypothetical protein